jgi:hypothetical protein
MITEHLHPSHLVCLLYNTHKEILKETIQFCISGLALNSKVILMQLLCVLFVCLFKIEGGVSLCG